MLLAALRQAGLNGEAENLAVEVLLHAAGRLSLADPAALVSPPSSGTELVLSGTKDGSKDASDNGNLDLFLDMMAAERGASANTLAAYRRDLQKVAAFLAKRGESLSAASSKNLHAYMVALKKRDMAASTAARHLSSQRRFSNSCKLKVCAKMTRQPASSGHASRGPCQNFYRLMKPNA